MSNETPIIRIQWTIEGEVHDKLYTFQKGKEVIAKVYGRERHQIYREYRHSWYETADGTRIRRYVLSEGRYNTLQDEIEG